MNSPPNKAKYSLSSINDHSKYTIIFIHGNSTDSSIWKYQLDSVLLGDNKKLALDLPGHGESRRERSYSFPEVVKTLIATIHDHPNVVLVGHSLGGHLAIEMLPHLPQCKGLFLFGSAPLKSPVNFDEAFLPNVDTGLLFQNVLERSDIEKFAQILSTDYATLEYDIVEKIENADSRFREGMSISVAKGELSDEVVILKDYRLPVAIIHGLNDSLINFDYLNELQIANLWRDKIHVISDCSHSPQIEKPEEFNQLLSEFLHDIG